MARDLEQLLHHTAVRPSTPVDPVALRQRGQRRRRLRHAAATAGSAVSAVLVIALAVVLARPTAELQPPEVVDRPEQLEAEEDPEDGTEDATDPEPPADGTEDAAEGLDEDADEDGDEEADEVETVGLEDAGWPLLVSGDDGVVRVDGGDERELWPDGVSVALSDLSGGVVLQEHEEGPVSWLPEGAETPEPIAADDERAVLVDVVDRDGPTTLFTRRTGEGDGEEETLYAYRLEEGTEEALGVTGALESGLGGAATVDGDLLLTSCHLECLLIRVPWGEDPAGDQAVDLHDGRALPIQGLDAQRGIAAYVHVTPEGIELEGEDDLPHLWWHDLGTDDRDEIALPEPDEIDEPSMLEVELSGDATAALVRFSRWDRPDEARTLLVEGLDDRPRMRWLDTGDRVQFDAPALATDTD